MKKNMMMRIASVLIVMTLLSTCAISGTFAKYVTSASSTDTARVAKFGVEITANGSMFSKNYFDVDGGNGVATKVKGSVDSSNTAKILAPGTKGKMVKMTLTGKPEVKVKVSYEATVTLTGWETEKSASDSSKTYYCPLKVTVGSTDYYGLDYSNATSFATAIKDAIEGYSQTYNALTDLSKKKTDSLAVSWEWAFEGANGTKVARTDFRDTYLGDQAAASNDANITIAITTTVTQVD